MATLDADDLTAITTIVNSIKGNGATLDSGVTFITPQTQQPGLREDSRVG